MAHSTVSKDTEMEKVLYGELKPYKITVGKLDQWNKVRDDKPNNKIK